MEKHSMRLGYALAIKRAADWVVSGSEMAFTEQYMRDTVNRNSVVEIYKEFVDHNWSILVDAAKQIVEFNERTKEEEQCQS